MTIRQAFLPLNLHLNNPSWCIYLARMERTAKQKLLTGRTGGGEQGQRILMFYRGKGQTLIDFLLLELQVNPTVFILAVCFIEERDKHSLIFYF